MTNLNLITPKNSTKNFKKINFKKDEKIEKIEEEVSAEESKSLDLQL